MILCVAKNYAQHAREMGAASPSAPVWFLKPASTVIGDGEPVRVPPGIGRVDHEVELALRIGEGGVPDAMTVAVDVTARDLQAEAKRKGRPWTMAKGFDTFLPLAAWVPIDAPEEQTLRLTVDDEVRQDGSTADMTFGIDALLVHAATWTTLRPGDIILTGTPEGVGPIRPGQTMVAELVGHARIENPVA